MTVSITLSILLLAGVAPPALQDSTASRFERVGKVSEVVPLRVPGSPDSIARFALRPGEIGVLAYDAESGYFRVKAEGSPYLVDPSAIGLLPPDLPPIGKDTQVGTGESLGGSYVVYLPPGYDPRQPPPMIFAFPPFGNGERFIQPLKESASRKGWVLIGCDGLSNGRNEVFFPTAREIIRHARRKIPHNRSREFLLGFSGGAMGSYRLSRVFWNEFAGIIALGGWLGVYEEELVYPSQLKVAMINGADDAGARENESRDREILKRFSIDTRIFRFPGGHTIPPVKTLNQAFDWIDRKARHGRPDRAAQIRISLSRGVNALQQKEYAAAVSPMVAILLEGYPGWETEAAETLLATALSSEVSLADLEISSWSAREARILFARSQGTSVASPAISQAYLEIANRLDPADHEIRARLAHSLLQLDSSSTRAVELAQVTTRQSPDYWLGWYVLALTRAEEGRIQDARSDMQRALRIAPNWAQTLCQRWLESWESSQQY